MVWSRGVEDCIWDLYYRYDIKGLKEQQEKLKRICMNELNAHEELKNQIKNNNQLEFFVMQMALENL